MKNVSSIAKFATENKRVTPEMALIDALDELRSGGIAPTKLLIIHIQEGLGDDGYGFRMGYFATGISRSEHLSLVEMHKAATLRDMGY